MTSSKIGIILFMVQPVPGIFQVSPAIIRTISLFASMNPAKMQPRRVPIHSVHAPE
jgi:hypothetical protein